MDKRQLKARFFGMHIGATLQKKGVDKVRLTGVSESTSGGFASYRYIGDEEEILQKYGSFGGDCYLADCKLILRPLSSMTKAESIKMANILFAENYWTVEKRLEMAGAIYQKFRQGNAHVHGDKGQDYLRSINICVPFMGLDPISEGWAILDEKFPANES